MEEYNLFETIKYNELFEVLSLWQQAFEWSFYDQVLANIQHVNEIDSIETPSFQALFCMDDRECSFRRYVEYFDENAATFGTPAFFNFEFYFQPVNGKFYSKLCPAPVTPKFLIKEEHRKKKHAKDLHYHKQSHSLFFGWIISQTLGFSSAFKLFLNIFRPSMSPATTASFKHLHKKSKLIIEKKFTSKTDIFELSSISKIYIKRKRIRSFYFFDIISFAVLLLSIVTFNYVSIYSFFFLLVLFVFWTMHLIYFKSFYMHVK